MHNGFLHVPDYLGIIKRGHEATVVCLGYPGFPEHNTMKP